MTAFMALLRRDLLVASRSAFPLLMATLTQPILVVLVFGNILPRLGLVADQFRTVMVPVSVPDPVSGRSSTSSCGDATRNGSSGGDVPPPRSQAASPPTSTRAAAARRRRTGMGATYARGWSGARTP